jgi:peptidoglycan/LPS O-acetylase OafA/YrhL
MSAPEPTPTPENKLLGLEAIRFVCALAVLFWHYQHFSFFADAAIGFARDRQPLYALFRPFYDFGYFGVTIFWCISGFIFFWKYRYSIAEGRVGRMRFFVLRFSRLYPLHLATLLLVAALQAGYFLRNGAYFVFQKNDALHFVLQVFFASNWASTTSQGDSFNGPIWSISVEVLVYCAFYLLLRRAGSAVWVNLAVLLLCLAAKFAHVPSPIVDCLAFFYAGGLSAIALRQVEDGARRALVHAIALALVAFTPPAVALSGVYQETHFTFLFLISYTPILLFVCARRFSVHPQLQKLVEAAGNMTYSSYLIHFPIQLAIALAFTALHTPMPYERLDFFIGFFALTLLAAYAIYRYFEMPAQSFIRRRYREGRIP